MEYNYIFLTLLISLLYIIYYCLMRGRNYWNERGIPYINSFVPYIGNIWPIILGRKSFYDTYSDIYKSTKCSMVGLWNCGRPELLIRDPELMKMVLQTNFVNFQSNVIELNPELDPLAKINPFFLSGAEWKHQRTVLTTNLSTSKLKNIAMAVSEVCELFSKFVNEKIQTNNGTYEVEAQKLFSRFTAQVVASAGFGVDGRCFTDDEATFQKMGEMMFQPTGITAFKQLIIFLFPSLATLLRTSFIPKEADEYFRKVVKDVLKLRKQTGIRGNDFIQQLYDSNKNEIGDVDEEFITGHAFSFFIDGYLTSSYTLGTVVFEIAQHPDVQEKLREEIKRVLNNHNGKINYDTIQDMKYMDLVIRETMRILPVVSLLQKKCTEKIKMIGPDGLQCMLNPGDILLLPTTVQMDPNYWENPEDFKPERFQDETKDDNQKCIYLPFGRGPRLCPGMRMAQLQMKGALTVLLNNFSLEVSPKTVLPLTFDPLSFLNTPRGGIWLKIKSLS